MRKLKTGIPGIGQWQKNILKCPKGHLYNEENTIIEKHGNKISRRCKICKNLRAKLYSRKTRKKGIERSKIFRLTNPDKINRYDHKSTIKKYGLSLEEYDLLLLKQNNVCAICKNSCSSGKRLSVDHSHTTNKIRGLLCGKCNKALGLLGDDIKKLEEAIRYLTNNL